MIPYSRRAFLRTTSRAAGLLVAARHAPLRAMSVHGLSSGEAQMPDELAPPAALEELAAAAMDAARSAGATYADVRLGERQTYSIIQTFNIFSPGVLLAEYFSYGVRVLVDGAWAFAHGTVPSIDAIASTAREAVASAQGVARAGVATKADFAPATTVTGRYETPIKIDPFVVPAEEQLALLNAYAATLSRSVGSFPAFDLAIYVHNFRWNRERRTIATTEGTMVTQTLRTGSAGFGGGGDRGMGITSVRPPEIIAGAGGYEMVLVPGISERIKVAAEDGTRMARLPRRPLPVGRYPVVFDGYATAKVFGETISPALELDRVLGEEADASGVSLFAPLEETLGSQIAPTFVNVSADRPLPSMLGAQWDDEGVVPEPYAVIENGRIVDFHTSRCTAPALAAWYAKQGRPLRSHGCSVAPDPENPVLVRAPHVTMAPASSTASLDDLCKELTHGILVREIREVSTDQQYAGGQFSWADMLEIERGKVVRRLGETALQFSTKALWKSLKALGDASTIRTEYSRLYKGQPWFSALHATTAPAAFFGGINVVSTGRAL